MASDVHALSGAYVLHALDEQERERFRRHVLTCGACAVEVQELQEAAARLADDAWEPVPERLRTRVLTQVRRTRQDRPRTRGRQPTTLPPRWLHRSSALVAACLVLVLALAVTYVVEENRLAEQRAVAVTIEDILTAPDARLHTAPVDGGGRITAVVAASRDDAVVLLSGAADIDTSQAYQLWLINGSVPVSAGVLGAGRADATVLISDVGDNELLAMTLEPAAGSPTPTLPILAQIPLVT